MLNLASRLTGLRIVDLDDVIVPTNGEQQPKVRLEKGDLVHVETPWNPTGEARDLAMYAAAAHEAGALVSVDATFGPPPLQDPFALGADVVMHSGTK